MGRLQHLDAAEDLAGGAPRAQLLVQQRPLALEQRQLDRGIAGGVLALAIEDLDQRRPAALALVEAGESGQRLGIALGDLQHLVPEVDRLARLVEPLGGQLGHLGQAVAALLGGDVRELFLVDLEQRLPGPAARVQLLEPLAGLEVRGIGLEDLLEAGHRVLVLAELLGPQRGDAPVQRQALRRLGGRLGLAREDLDEVGPAPLRLVARRQRRQRRRVVGLERDDAQVGVDHHDVQVQAISIDRDDIQVTIDLFVDRLGRDRLEILLEQLEQRVPLLGARVEPLERLDRLGQVRLQAQQALPDVDRLLGVLLVPLPFRGLAFALGLALLDGARHLDAHRHLAVDVGLGLLRLRQQRHQLRDLVPAGEVVAIEVDHRAVARVDLAHAAEDHLGLLDLAELLPQQIGELDQQRHVLLAALGARSGVEDFRQLGPALLRAQRRGHGAQRPVLDRVRLQRLLEVRHRLIGAAQLVGQLARRHLGDGAIVLAGRLLGAPADQIRGARRPCRRRAAAAPGAGSTGGCAGRAPGSCAGSAHPRRRRPRRRT